MSESSSSVPSARTVTRWRVQVFDVFDYAGPAEDGRTMIEVIPASEVDPLLTALADEQRITNELIKAAEGLQLEIDMNRAERKRLEFALAERAQEIERLKGAAESDAEEYIKAVQVVGEMTEQIHALTARAEAAEAALKALKEPRAASHEPFWNLCWRLQRDGSIRCEECRVAQGQPHLPACSEAPASNR